MNGAPRPSRSLGEAVRHHAFWFRDRLKEGDVAQHLRDLEDHAADQAAVFERVDGRLVETIYHPSGAKPSPYVINNAVRDVPHVLQYQFAQTGGRHYHLAIVRLPGFREESLIRNRLGEIVGPQADLTIRYVTSIAPLPSGKRQYILNRWKVAPASGGGPIPTSRG